eukprot:6665481-Karenia_brevis.AAC.1
MSRGRNTEDVQGTESPRCCISEGGVDAVKDLFKIGWASRSATVPLARRRVHKVPGVLPGLEGGVL